MSDNIDFDKYNDLCSCGDRPASECSGEWEPDCSLGNSLEHAKVSSSFKTYEEGIAEGKRQMVVELKRQDATVYVHRNEAGQISLYTPSGASWDMSKHIGSCLYAHPIPPPDVQQGEAVRELVEALESLVNCIDETRGPDADEALHNAHALLIKHRGQS